MFKRLLLMVAAVLVLSGCFNGTGRVSERNFAPAHDYQMFECTDHGWVQEWNDDEQEYEDEWECTRREWVNHHVADKWTFVLTDKDGYTGTVEVTEEQYNDYELDQWYPSYKEANPDVK